MHENNNTCILLVSTLFSSHLVCSAVSIQTQAHKLNLSTWITAFSTSPTVGNLCCFLFSHHLPFLFQLHVELEIGNSWSAELSFKLCSIEAICDLPWAFTHLFSLQTLLSLTYRTAGSDSHIQFNIGWGHLIQN